MGKYVRKPGAYPAVVSRIGRIYEVPSVDFPNYVAAGKDRREAEKNAKSALGVYIAVLERFHNPPPLPTTDYAGDSNMLDRYVTYWNRRLRLTIHRYRATVESR